jgi:hypothetical protein
MDIFITKFTLSGNALRTKKMGGNGDEDNPKLTID